VTGSAASAAPVAKWPCATTAKIVHTHGKGYLAWAGKETKGAVKHFHGSKLTEGAHFWELHGETITLSFDHNTYALAGDAVFMMGCSGLAAGDKAVMPSITMLTGTAVVKTTDAVEGSVLTEENLIGQRTNGPGMTYSVARKLHQHHALTMQQKINWFLNYSNQPTGSTTSKTLTHHKKLNITPYVGSKHGTCRTVKSAVLTTSGSYGHGHAVYHF
jgi:hypothetical protein